MTETSNYDGLSDDEVAAHLASSEQRSDEDHTTWTQRVAAEEAKVRKLITDRHTEAIAEAPPAVEDETPTEALATPPPAPEQ